MWINVLLQKIIRHILNLSYMVYAKITRKRFYCNALTGNSYYNITINSDMTVSCNCQDCDGSGNIGDLAEQSLEEIFKGDIATKYRNLLSQGKLPTLVCSRCSDLKWTTIDNADYYTKNYKIPNNGILVENTVNCNLSCLSCDRKTITNLRKKRFLTLDDIEKVSAILGKQEMKQICYFNLGEPFFSNNIYEELQIVRKHNLQAHILISTNGILINTKNKMQAALLSDHIVFSLDGINTKITSKYQRKSDFDKAYNNMTELVKLRNDLGLTKPLIEWKYILFNWNDKKEYIEKAIEMAKNAGVDKIAFYHTKSPIYGMSFKYYFSKYLKELGTPFGYGREVIFKK